MSTGIIKSILDDDLYKFTMQQAVLKLYHGAEAEFRFKNRGTHKFSEKFIPPFEQALDDLSKLSLTNDEADFLKTKPFIFPWYVEYLRSYRFDPSCLNYAIKDDNLELSYKGPWYEKILWEVVLMAIISEVYFKVEDTNWNMDEQENLLRKKTNVLMCAHCKYADFGTRRRRSYEVQDFIVSKMKNHHWFAGTSNVHLAHKHGVRPIGTMAHEWIQGISALESMNHPNRFMLEKWMSVYGTDLGVALTDTYGTASFFKDFDKKIASVFAGVRHDSGDPFEFADKVVAHYKKLGIDPGTKVIVFSDGLSAELAVEIQAYCDKIGIPCSFGIGTSFTNDFPGSKALNMVIKMWSMNGMPVVKLSDVAGKANGEDEMVRFMKFIHGM